MATPDTCKEIVVMITSPGEEEAAAIARTLVEERLAACVTIIRNVRSIYSWQGKVEDGAEILMMAKTRGELFDSLKERVKQMHSYDVPEIIALPIMYGSEDYLKWLRNSTGKAHLP
ncbi:MAG: divalent-cation tolerance protein CutA [Nitrospirae bacterium]|nr:divalent-cation tolerance protein CutA [Nitrospirota bacterium]